MHQHTTPSSRLSRWEREPHGQFALEQERRFLLQMISTWRRRQRTMLYVECGTGSFLECLWEAGFDVSATASNVDDLRKARTRIGSRAELFLSQPDFLPFEDRSYDYVLLVTALNYCPSPRDVLQEAARVCAKELLITFLNKYSLYACSQLISRSSHPIRWWSWLSMRTFIKQVLGQRPLYTYGGILPGPYISWQQKPLVRSLNTLLCPNTFGAYCGLVLDMTTDPVCPLLPAWVHQQPKPSTPCSPRIRISSPPPISHSMSFVKEAIPPGYLQP